MEQIYILKETTKFNYGDIMWEKLFYYKTNQLVYKAKIQYENIESERVYKSKEISKIPYKERISKDLIFENQNGFYKVEYSILNAPIITEVLEETES